MSDPNAQILVLKQTVAALLLRIQYPSLSRLLSSNMAGDGDLLVKDVLLLQAQLTNSCGGVWPSLLGLTNTPTVKMLEELAEGLAEILEGLDRLIFPADLGRDLVRVQEGPTVHLCKRAHEATWTLNRQIRMMQRAIRKLVRKASQTQPELIHVIRETEAGSEPLFYGDYETACHVLRATRRFLPADKFSSLYLLMPGNRRVFADELPDLAIEAPKSMYDRHFRVLERAFEETRTGLKLIAEFVPYDGEQLQYAKQNVQHLQRLARNLLQNFDNRPELEIDPRSQQAEEAIDTLVDTLVENEELLQPTEPEKPKELDLYEELRQLQEKYQGRRSEHSCLQVSVVGKSIEDQDHSDYGTARLAVTKLVHGALADLTGLERHEQIVPEWPRQYIVRPDGSVSMPLAASQRQLLSMQGQKYKWRKPAEPMPSAELSAEGLRAKVKEHQPDSLFFSPDNMAFAGDTMANYRVALPAKVTSVTGEIVDAYELIRIRPVKNGLQRSAWFRVDNFKRVHVRVNDKTQLEVELGFGFRAVPVADVTFNGHVTGATRMTSESYTGLWNVIAPNGKALDAAGSNRPCDYATIDECQEDVDMLVKLGEWSTCP